MEHDSAIKKELLIDKVIYFSHIFVFIGRWICFRQEMVGLGVCNLMISVFYWEMCTVYI